jgi:hypothetical protein
VRLRLPSPGTAGGLMGVGMALTAVFVGLAGLVAVNAMARQTITKEHTYDFTGSTVSIDAAIGDVQVVPGGPGRIVVRQRLTYGLWRPSVEERIDGDTFRVRDTECRAALAFPCGVRWLLQVPRDISIEVRTVSGSISVSGLSGTIKLTSESGAVRAFGPSGRVITLRSHDGPVTAQNVSSAQVVATSDNRAVSLTFRSPPALVIGRSQRGPIGVVLPDGPDTYKVKAKSQSQGASRTVAAKTSDDARRLIDIFSENGDVSVIQSPEQG